MNHYTIVGWAGNATTYCDDHAPTAEDGRMTGFNPIYAGDEWEWPGATCDECHEILDTAIVNRPDRPPISRFMIGYVECALWSSLGEDGTSLDHYNDSDLDAQSLWDMYQDCQDFQKLAGHMLDDMDPEQAGHDFWLTRNRHGARFWDRGLGERGRKLIDLAHKWGPCDIFETGDEDYPLAVS